MSKHSHGTTDEVVKILISQGLNASEAIGAASKFITLYMQAAGTIKESNINKNIINQQLRTFWDTDNVQKIVSATKNELINLSKGPNELKTSFNVKSLTQQRKVEKAHITRIDKRDSKLNKEADKFLKQNPSLGKPGDPNSRMQYAKYNAIQTMRNQAIQMQKQYTERVLQRHTSLMRAAPVIPLAPLVAPTVTPPVINMIEEPTINVPGLPPITMTDLLTPEIPAPVTPAPVGNLRLRSVRKHHGPLIIGCAFNGAYDIVPVDNNDFYIPSSGYCFIKCIEYIYKIKIATTGLNPYGTNYAALRKFFEKLGYAKIPPVYRACLPEEHLNDKWITSENMHYYIKFKLVETNKGYDRSTPYSILILHTSEFSEYHAIVYKHKKPIKDLYDVIWNNMKFEKITKLTEDQKPMKIDNKVREAQQYMIPYDIETYVTFDPKTHCRTLTPIGVSYNLIDLECSKGTEDMEKNILERNHYIGEDCLEKMIESIVDICKNKNLKKIYIIAHNGGCFDNIYLKGLKSLHIESQIKKGRIKRIDFVHKESDIKIIAVDSFCFTQSSLKDSAKYFKLKENKTDFDIVDKPKEWFLDEARPPGAVSPASDANKKWIDYMDQDTKVLSLICLHFEQILRQWGSSFTVYTGIPSTAWHMILKTCPLLKKVYITKDPVVLKFMSDARYGGRIIHWMKHYIKSAAEKYGLICVDGNNLYPSGMTFGIFPIGPYKTFNDGMKVDDYIKSIKDGKLSIFEVTLNANNQRYTLVPYRSDEGCITYPCGIFRGVYTSVDIEEALNDGYTIVEVHRGIMWDKSGDIFSELIKHFFLERANLKAHENPMEYAFKIMLNSYYGYMALMIDMISFFTDNGKTDKKHIPVSISLLTNGQFEHNSKLEHPICDKPVHIAAFILSYSRKIMNNNIRKLGPENIAYGDTDSLYVKGDKVADLIENDKTAEEDNILMEKFRNKEKVTLEEDYELTALSNKLGCIKNDYGYINTETLLVEKFGNILAKIIKNYTYANDSLMEQKSVFLKEAIFLDIKRCYIEFDIMNAKGKQYTAKFTGLNFKNKIERTVQNFISGDDSIKDGVKKIYLSLQENPEKSIKIIQDKWRRYTTEVCIDEIDINYVVSPDVRNIWKGNYSYPLNFDFDKPYNTLGPITKWRKANKSDVYNKNYHIYDTISSGLRIEANFIPIYYPPFDKNGKLAKKYMDIEWSVCCPPLITHKVKSNFIKILDKDIIYQYIDNKAYLINEYGAYKQVPVPEEFDYVLALSYKYYKIIFKKEPIFNPVIPFYDVYNKIDQRVNFFLKTSVIIEANPLANN